MKTGWAAVLSAGLIAGLGAREPAGYFVELEAWRTHREAALQKDDGWLTVAGLHWLREGTHTMGSAADNDVVLPQPVPPRAGRLTFTAGRTLFDLEKGVRARVDGLAVRSGELKPDSDTQLTVLSFGPVSLFVIQRGDRFGVRVKDLNSGARKDFQGLTWHPPRPAYRVVGRFVAHPRPATLHVPNVLGQVVPMPSPGYVTFELEGRQLRLHPVTEDAEKEELFFIFKDSTSGVSTYPAGRFLYSPPVVDGTTVLDFNKAYNPPCAFTAYATCPLPPRVNHLQTKIEAGELTYGHH